MSQQWISWAHQVLDGQALGRAQALEIIRSGDDQLLGVLDAAFQIRRRFFGHRVQLYYLKNAKSGLCGEDCGYCSQSAVSSAPIEKYSMLSAERLLEGARQAAAAEAGTYCIVTSGRGPSGRDVDHVATVVKQIKAETNLHVCCCLGILSPEQARRLKAAGVDRINHNLNTSRNFHDQICSTHTYEDRLSTLRTARDAGLELCSGLIVGMGESAEDLVDAALELSRLQVESIPINFLHAIEGTPLEHQDELDPRACLRALCLFRFLNPGTEIRIAGGREVQLRSLQAMGLYPANSIFVSDYLTTAGQGAEKDLQMIRDLGFEVVPEGHEARQLSPASAE
jgi:biotin synthase